MFVAPPVAKGYTKKLYWIVIRQVNPIYQGFGEILAIAQLYVEKEGGYILELARNID